jgi:hypothetical protein
MMKRNRPAPIVITAERGFGVEFGATRTDSRAGFTPKVEPRVIQSAFSLALQEQPEPEGILKERVVPPPGAE